MPEGAAQRTDGATSKPAIGRRMLAVRMLILTGAPVGSAGSGIPDDELDVLPMSESARLVPGGSGCGYRDHNPDFSVKSLDWCGIGAPR